MSSHPNIDKLRQRVAETAKESQDNINRKSWEYKERAEAAEAKLTKVVETAREVKEAFDPEDYDDLFSPPARLDAYERLVAALAALDKEER